MIENLSNEEWKDIENYEGLYQISNLGRVKSLAKVIKTWYRTCNMREKLLKLCSASDGYFIVILCKKGNNKTYRVSRLVAQAFIPNPDNYPQVNHINSIRTDNKVKNLEWCTAQYNVIHSYKNGFRHGTKGEKCPFAKLTNKQVLEIRQKYIPYKYTYNKLAKEYKIHPIHVGHIIRRQSWKHI